MTAKNPTDIISKKDAEKLEEIRRQIMTYKKDITKAYYSLARLLNYVRRAMVNGKPIYAIWGYSTFEEYCEEELHYSIRKGQMLAAIADMIETKVLPTCNDKNAEQVVISDIDEIGWVKANMLVKVVNNKKDFDMWVGRAKKLGKKDLAELVYARPLKGGDLEDGKPEKFVNMKIQLLPSGQEVVGAVFEHIRRVNGENLISGPSGDGMVLVRLCQHYLSNLKDDHSVVDVNDLLTSIMDTYEISEITYVNAAGEKIAIKKKDQNNGEQEQ